MNNLLPVILSVVHFVFERMVKIVKVMMYVIIFMVMEVPVLLASEVHPKN